MNLKQWSTCMFAWKNPNEECSAVNNPLSKPYPSDTQPRFVETAGEVWDNEEQCFWVRKR